MLPLSPLSPDQRDLIHRGIDGAVTSLERSELEALLVRHPEAQALHADLLQLAAEFRSAGERVPPPGLRAAILARIERPLPATGNVAGRSFDIATSIRSFVHTCRSIITDLEGSMTRKTLLVGTFAVAVIAIIGYAAGGYPPNGMEFGTIGAGDSIGGVERASRYKGRSMDERDVSLTSPEVQALFQNDQVLKLVQSDAFRETMKSEAFRNLQSSEAFRNLMNYDAFHELMANEAFRNSMANDAFAKVLSNDAFHTLMAQESFREAASRQTMQAFVASNVYRESMSNVAFRTLLSSDAFRNLLSNDAFRNLLSNEVFAHVMSNVAFREALSNQSFREALSNDAFRLVLANDAFRNLQASDAFRDAARTAASSDAFLAQAMRMAP